MSTEQNEELQIILQLIENKDINDIMLGLQLAIGQGYEKEIKMISFADTELDSIPDIVLNFPNILYLNFREDELMKEAHKLLPLKKIFSVRFGSYLITVLIREEEGEIRKISVVEKYFPSRRIKINNPEKDIKRLTNLGRLYLPF